VAAHARLDGAAGMVGRQWLEAGRVVAGITLGEGAGDDVRYRRCSAAGRRSAARACLGRLMAGSAGVPRATGVVGGCRLDSARRRVARGAGLRATAGVIGRDRGRSACSGRCGCGSRGRRPGRRRPHGARRLCGLVAGGARIACAARVIGRRRTNAARRGVAGHARLGTAAQMIGRNGGYAARSALRGRRSARDAGIQLVAAGAGVIGSARMIGRDRLRHPTLLVAHQAVLPALERMRDRSNAARRSRLRGGRRIRRMTDQA
jgi:hypothetical protein